MDAIKAVLPVVLRKRGLESQANAALVSYRAEKWLWDVLPALQGAISVQKLDHGTLTIRCRNSVALQECSLLSGRLVTYLLTVCGDSVPEDLATRIVRS